MEDVIIHAQLHERSHPLFKTALNFLPIQGLDLANFLGKSQTQICMQQLLHHSINQLYGVSLLITYHMLILLLYANHLHRALGYYTTITKTSGVYLCLCCLGQLSTLNVVYRCSSSSTNQRVLVQIQTVLHNK